MITRLHKCARTTPRVRAEIAASQDSMATLARRYGISPMTVLKWMYESTTFGTQVGVGGGRI
ncbi:MAG: hypothetical protein ACPLXR_04335, partial [Halothiobacillaceae bacterium]